MSMRDICFRDLYSFSQFQSFPNVRHSSDILLNNKLIIKSVNNVVKKEQVAFSVIDVIKKGDHNNSENFYEKKIIELINFFAKKPLSHSTSCCWIQRCVSVAYFSVLIIVNVGG